MCELFGVSSLEKIKLNGLLTEFFSHGIDHPHGWGLAFFDNYSLSLKKEPVLSCDSEYLRTRLESEIVSDKMIGHIRNATRGSMDYDNTHPFIGKDNCNRTWTLAHNGTIFGCELLDPYADIQKGHTDSERILLYILDCVGEEQNKKGAELTAQERFQLLDRVILKITPGNNKVNLLIYDGELLYVHTNLKDSLHYLKDGDSLIFSTTALDHRQWKDVPMNVLMAFEEGRLIFKGTQHENEYFLY